MKTKNFKFKSMALVLFALVLSSNVWGETIYHETFGKNETSATIAWGDASSYLSDSKSSIYCESTGWKISKYTSVVCDVEGTSGNSHLFSQTASQAFVLKFGDLSGYTNVTLTLNWKNGASTKNNRTLTIKPSANGGTSWGSDLIGSNKSQSWQTLIYNIPEASLSNFAIEITNTSTNDSRIDDIKLAGEAAGPSCTNKITITKGTETNGTFELSQTGEVCIDEGNATVDVTDIQPAEHYHFSQITATNGSVDNENKKVTNISANTTITVEFAADTKHTISFLDKIQSEEVDDIEVYGGATFTFPVLTDKTATTTGTCEQVHYHFMGWVISTHTGDITDSDIKTGTSDAVSAPAIYKAVWAAEEQE